MILRDLRDTFAEVGYAPQQASNSGKLPSVAVKGSIPGGLNSGKLPSVWQLRGVLRNVLRSTRAQSLAVFVRTPTASWSASWTRLSRRPWQQPKPSRP